MALREELLASLSGLASHLNTDPSGAAVHVLRAHVEARARVLLTPRQLMAAQAEARGHL